MSKCLIKAREIYQAPRESREDFFNELLDKIEDSYDTDLLKEIKIVDIIQNFLKFSTSKKKLIMFLVYEVEFFHFRDLISLLTENPDYFKGFSRDEFYKAFDIAGDKFVVRNKTLKECIDFVILLNKKYLKVDTFFNEYSENFESFDEMEEKIREFNNQRGARLIEPAVVELPRNCYELVSKLELIKEAKSMMNCLEQYVERIKLNHFRIFHIEFGNNKAIASFVKTEQGISMSEIKGFANSEVKCNEIYKISRDILEQLLKNPECLTVFVIENLCDAQNQEAWVMEYDGIIGDGMGSCLGDNINSKHSENPSLGRIVRYHSPKYLRNYPEMDRESIRKIRYEDKIKSLFD